MRSISTFAIPLSSLLPSLLRLTRAQSNALVIEAQCVETVHLSKIGQISLSLR